MLSSEEVRTKVNMYIYLLNKHNVFGIFAGIIMSKYLLGLVSPADVSFTRQILMTIFWIVSISFATKIIILKVFKLKDVCECKPEEKEYDHPKINTCPKEETIFGVYDDIRNVAEETAINIGFRYNLAAFIILLLVIYQTGLFQLGLPLSNPFNIVAILLTVIFIKMAINYFFIIQKYCPCHCEYKPTKNVKPGSCKAPNTKEIEKEVRRDIKDAKKGVIHADDLVSIVNQEIEDVVREGNTDEDPTIDEIEKEIEKEVKNMLPSQHFDARLKDLCKIASDRLRRYDTLDDCLTQVKSDPNVQQTVKTMLMDDPTYSCLSQSSNGTQFDICFKDYFSKHPQFLLRLVDAFPNTK